jgi:SAM-dependent methyltransferase
MSVRWYLGGMDYGRAAQHWDRQHFDQSFLRGEWSFHPAAKAKLHKLLGFGAREEWFWANYLNGKSNLRGLGIGVGLAKTELSLLTTGVFSSYDLYDVSPVALDAAKEDATAIGVVEKCNFLRGDIYETDLGSETYDVVTFVASLHHMEDLDGILAKCKRALKPGGVLWAIEYIGPDRFQYPPEHTEFAKRFFRSVHPGLTKVWCPELTPPTVAEVISVDPTESVHSSDIPRAMNAAFDDVTTLYTYGTFAFILFWGLLHDALYESVLGNEFVETVMEIDEMLIDTGKLPHYFAYFVAKK